jgi:DNA-binding XRE family transcriptional regulator
MLTDSKSKRERGINRLQQNLAAIRKVAGWTTAQLGEKIGVSKQTISNLENGKSPMNFTQYIAIRSIFDCEIETNTANEVLPRVVSILLDSSEDEYKKFSEPVGIVAASAAGGVTGGALLGLLSALAPLSGVGIVGGIACATWLKNLLKK